MYEYLLEDNELEEIPIYSEDLINFLDKLIPEKCHDIYLTKEENIIYSGKRELINFLILIKNKTKD